MNLFMFGAFADFCGDMAGLLKMIGYILWVFKIAIPVIIVVFGIIDLGKAVTASKDDEIKKALKQLMVRLIAGILIFFIPTLIMFVFELITNFTDIQSASNFDLCEACILRPGSIDCDTNEITN